MKRVPKLFAVSVFSAILIISGCSSSKGPKPNNDAPEALTYSTTSAVYTQGVAIAANTPSVTKTVTSWSVNPSLPAGLTLNASTGVISGTPTILQSATQYIITAGNSYGSTTATISITINLAPPKALSYQTTSAVYYKDVAITSNTPTVTGTVTSWAISPALPSGLTISSSTGVISGTPTAVQSAIQYQITAANAYGSTTAVVSITVNLAAPKALSYSSTSAVYTLGFVIENNVPTVTGTVSSWKITPALPSGLSLNNSTGVISGTPVSKQTTIHYTITASNATGSATAVISITINEAAPTALTYATTSAVYTKDAVISSNIPEVTGTVTSWDISPALPAGLTLNTTNGRISGTPETTQAATQYTVTAGNSGGYTTAVISITINYAAPTALSYSTTSAVYTKNAVITDNTPTVTGTVTSWSISPSLPAGLTLNTTTGAISGTPTTTQTTIQYTVTAGNSGGYTTAVISITINYAAPTALSYSTTSAVYTKGAVITDNTPTVTGTVTSWSISPSLPAGLTLNTSTGVISGTPTTTQTAIQYTITAGNSGGSTTAVISITINYAAPTALTYSKTSAVYTKDAVIASNTPTVTGTVTSWSISPALPSGLTINSSTGIISGTPASVQTAKTYTIKASNSGGYTTAAISITINYAAPTSLTYSTVSAVYTKDAVISENIPAVTGTVTSWAVSPALPVGLTLNTTTGVLSGTPSAIQAAKNYVITATNSGGSTTVTISITINYAAPASLTYAVMSAVYTKGAVITINIPTVTGTITAWSVSPALPSGLTLNTTTGAISGTPLEIQSSADYTVTASNSGGSVDATISITINYAAPTGLTYSRAPAVYAKDRVITDNTPTVTGTVTSWAVTPDLPAGLILNTTTGVISGTPTATQSAANYTIAGSNSGGSTSVTISIAVKVITIYIGGSSWISTGPAVPGYWKNDIWNELPALDSTKNASVNSLAVSGTDVYAGGNCYNSSDQSIPGYWKNTSWISLISSSLTSGHVSAIAIANNAVYAGGTYGNVAAYWRNGVLNTLPDVYETGSSNNSEITSLAVSDTTVYAGGYCRNKSLVRIPGYWEIPTTGVSDPEWNSGQHPLNYSTVTCIAYSSSAGVYAGGDGYNEKIYDIPGYWHYTWWSQAYPLSNSGSSSVTSIAISGADIYMSGYGYDTSTIPIPAYWKNGVDYTLPAIDSSKGGKATGITVADNIYIAGNCTDSTSISVAGYWENGTWHTLPTFNGAAGSSATSIVVITE